MFSESFISLDFKGRGGLNICRRHGSAEGKRWEEGKRARDQRTRRLDGGKEEEVKEEKKRRGEKREE